MPAPDIVDYMKRREFILLFAGAVGSPLATAAQQRASTPRLGVLINLASDDSEGQARMAAFRTSLKKLGWEVDQNIVIDYRWAAGEIEHVRALESDLVQLAPNVLLVSGTTAFVAIQDQTQTIPIVFVNVAEQTVMRFTGSLARPAGNATGFPEKYLEALREIAPSISRALIAEPDNPASVPGKRAIEDGSQIVGCGGEGVCSSWCRGNQTRCGSVRTRAEKGQLDRAP
jgi:putative tryptophan/tyrosine transport system substrate-binding protein